MTSLSRGCKLRITVVPTAVKDDCYANIFVRGGRGEGAMEGGRQVALWEVW